MIGLFTFDFHCILILSLFSDTTERPHQDNVTTSYPISTVDVTHQNSTELYEGLLEWTDEESEMVMKKINSTVFLLRDSKCMWVMLFIFSFHLFIFVKTFY